MTFLSHSPECSLMPKPASCKYKKFNGTPTFLMTFFRHSLKSCPFHPCFNPHTCKVTTTTSQFTFYNCKWYFTTAEIVISYTLIYALDLTKQDCPSEAWTLEGDSQHSCPPQSNLWGTAPSCPPWFTPLLVVSGAYGCWSNV